VAYEFPEKRQLCENCKRPSKVCFCDVIPEEKLDHSTTVCILQVFHLRFKAVVF
jgi:DTW domain-containing protein YfiP